jgi:hypothetical protein
MDTLKELSSLSTKIPVIPVSRIVSSCEITREGVMAETSDHDTSDKCDTSPQSSYAVYLYEPER